MLLGSLRRVALTATRRGAPIIAVSLAATLLRPPSLAAPKRNYERAFEDTPNLDDLIGELLGEQVEEDQEEEELPGPGGLTIEPGALAERIFSLLKLFFGEQQDAALSLI